MDQHEKYIEKCVPMVTDWKDIYVNLRENHTLEKMVKEKFQSRYNTQLSNYWNKKFYFIFPLVQNEIIVE